MNRRGFLTAVVAVVAAPVVARAQERSYLLEDPWLDRAWPVPESWTRHMVANMNIAAYRPGPSGLLYDLIPPDLGPVYTSGLLPLNYETAYGNTCAARDKGSRRRRRAARRCRW